MADAKQLEMDRIKNLLKSFSWDQTGASIEGDRVEMSFSKDMGSQVQSLRMFEAERIGTMAKNFGWDMKTLSIELNPIRIAIVRTIVQEK